MKKIVILMLTLIAIAIADEEEDIMDLAEEFDVDEKTIRICLDETEINRDEIDAAQEEWMVIIENNNFTEEAKQSVAKINCFLACLFEQKNLMKNTKFVSSKILQEMENKNKDKNIPDKEIIIECINNANKGDMTKENRVFEFIVCIVNNYKAKR